MRPGQRIRWTYWIGNPLPISAIFELSKIFEPIRHSISTESFIHLMLNCLRGGSIRASPTFLLSDGHSAFPDQRMALFKSRFQCAENSLLCPSVAKGAHFAGIFGDCWLLFADLKRGKTVWWWTQSPANPSPSPFSLLTGNLTGKSPNFGSRSRMERVACCTIHCV